MEIIPIKNSTVNGQNAYNYGEWQGAIPCHWFSSKMILKPYERKNSFDSKKLIILCLFRENFKKEIFMIKTYI